MTDNSSANKRLTKNSFFLSIRMVIVLLITFYATRVILATLGVEDYGVYNVVCGFVSMFAFLNTSMSNGIQRFFNYEYGKNGEEGAVKVYNTALIIQAILAVIIFVVVESLGIWYINSKMVIPVNRMIAAQWIFQFALISFVFNIFQAPYTAAVMAHERMDFYAFVSIFDAVFKLLIVYTLPVLGGDFLFTYGFLWMFISIINWILYFIYTKHNFKEIRFIKGHQKDLFKSMLSFSGWNMFGSFSGVMKEQGINLIINLFYGPVVNAARAVASQVNGGMESFVMNVTIPVRPQVVQSYAKGDIARTMNLTYGISKLSCFVFYIAALPIIVEIDYILQLWLGNNVPEHTSVFIVIILMTTMIANLNSAVSNVVHASGKMRKYQVTTGLIGIVSVPVAYIALKLGAKVEIALFITFLSKVIAQYFSLIILKGIVEYSLFDYCNKVLWPIFLVILLTFWVPILPKYFMQASLLRLLVISVTSVVFVCLSIYAIGLNSSEKQMIKQIACKLKKC